jgi:hypothetical protein
MAVVNVKGLPEALNDGLKLRAEPKRRSLVGEVVVPLESALPTSPQHSTLELRGLGKHLWQGANASAHVKNERAAWD